MDGELKLYIQIRNSIKHFGKMIKKILAVNILKTNHYNNQQNDLLYFIFKILNNKFIN